MWGGRLTFPDRGIWATISARSGSLARVFEGPSARPGPVRAAQGGMSHGERIEDVPGSGDARAGRRRDDGLGPGRRARTRHQGHRPLEGGPSERDIKVERGAPGFVDRRVEDQAAGRDHFPRHPNPDRPRRPSVRPGLRRPPILRRPPVHRERDRPSTAGLSRPFVGLPCLHSPFGGERAAEEWGPTLWRRRGWWRGPPVAVPARPWPASRRSDPFADATRPAQELPRQQPADGGALTLGRIGDPPGGPRPERGGSNTTSTRKSGSRRRLRGSARSPTKNAAPWPHREGRGSTTIVSDVRDAAKVALAKKDPQAGRDFPSRPTRSAVPPVPLLEPPAGCPRRSPAAPPSSIRGEPESNSRPERPARTAGSRTSTAPPPVPRPSRNPAASSPPGNSGPGRNPS